MIRFALLQPCRQVFPGMRAPRVVQTPEPFTHLDHQGGGAHPGALLGPRDAQRLGARLPLLVLLAPRQHSHRRVVLRDQLSLGRQGLERRQDHRTTVADLLTLVPLRRIGNRHPQHRLVALQAVQG